MQKVSNNNTQIHSMTIFITMISPEITAIALRVNTLPAKAFVVYG